MYRYIPICVCYVYTHICVLYKFNIYYNNLYSDLNTRVYTL